MRNARPYVALTLVAGAAAGAAAWLAVSPGPNLVSADATLRDHTAQSWAGLGSATNAASAPQALYASAGDRGTLDLDAQAVDPASPSGLHVRVDRRDAAFETSTDHQQVLVAVDAAPTDVLAARDTMPASDDLSINTPADSLSIDPTGSDEPKQFEQDAAQAQTNFSGQHRQTIGFTPRQRRQQVADDAAPATRPTPVGASAPLAEAPETTATAAPTSPALSTAQADTTQTRTPQTQSSPADPEPVVTPAPEPVTVAAADPTPTPAPAVQPTAVEVPDATDQVADRRGQATQQSGSLLDGADVAAAGTVMNNPDIGLTAPDAPTATIDIATYLEENSYTGDDATLSNDINRVISWFNIGWSGNRPEYRHVGRNLDWLGWQNWVKRDVQPQVDMGVRRILLHNPFGVLPGEIMQLDQYLHAKADAPAFLIDGFVEAWKPITDQGVEVIAYVGCGALDPNFENLDRDAWLARAFASVKPILDANMSVALDAAAFQEAGTMTHVFAEELRNRGVIVYVEAKPGRAKSHWFDYNVMALDGTFLRDDINTGIPNAREIYGIPNEWLTGDICRITRPRMGESASALIGDGMRDRVHEIIRDGHTAVTDLHYWLGTGRTFEELFPPESMPSFD